MLDRKMLRKIGQSAGIFAALVVFLTCGYFQNSRPGWNVNSQFGLTYAIVFDGTLSIDRYHSKLELATGDKALIDGHYYSDKSPVTAFMGIPALGIYKLVARLGFAPIQIFWMRWWTTWLTIGLCAAAMVWMITQFLVMRGIRPWKAIWGSVLWIAATPLMGYSILFFNYLSSCAMMTGGLLLIFPWLTDAFPKRHWSRIFFAGILFGLAAWTLNTCALAALLVTIALIFHVMTGKHDKRIRTFCHIMLPWALGGIFGAIGNFVYIYILTGSFSSLYAYEATPLFREQMSRGFLGAIWPPDWTVVKLILLHPHKGLFLWFPITLLAVFGCFHLLWRVRREHLIAWIALLTLAGLVLYNACYYMWWGGWAYAPRHLIPALGLLWIGLIPWLHSKNRLVVWLFFIIGGIGAIINISQIAVDPQPSPGFSDRELMQPQRIHRWTMPNLYLLSVFWKAGHTDMNFGYGFGLKDQWSLLPLAILWGAFMLATLVLRWKLSSGKADVAPPQKPPSP